MERYQIHISGLKLFGFHGVLPHEAEIGQFFILDLTLEVERSSRADDVSSIVDYGKVSEVVKLAFDSNRYQLIESLADAIFSSLKALIRIYSFLLFYTTFLYWSVGVLRLTPPGCESGYTDGTALIEIKLLMSIKWKHGLFSSFFGWLMCR